MMNIDQTCIYRVLRKSNARLVRRGRYELLRLRNPGTKLDSADQASLVAFFSSVTDSIYRVDTAAYWKTRPRYFDDLTEIWTAHADGNLVGWIGIAILELNGQKAIYVDTLNVRPCSFGGYTIGSVLIHEVFLAQYMKFGRVLPFAMRTQNPGVYRLVQSLSCDGVYPAIGRERGPHKSPMKSVAQALAARLSPTRHFNADLSVIKQAFPGVLYNPSLGIDPALADYWREHIDAVKGDALIVVVRPDLGRVLALAAAYLWAAWRDRWLRRIGRIPVSAR